MKNIAIFGSSRAGKSTLSRMIAKKYPNYHIIVGDDVRYAFQKVLPNNNINAQNGIGMIDDFPKFLSCLFYKSIKENKGVFNYIVETCDMLPKKAQELFCKENTVLLFIGTPRLTALNHFKEIREFETRRDWTYKISDEEIISHCEYWINKSKEYKKQCKELNIWYVDTSFDREKVLNNTLEKIGQLILKNSR